MEIVLAVIGVALTVGSIVYAIKTNRAKADLERLIRSRLAGIAGNIDSIRKNPSWADNHLKEIQRSALLLNDSNEKKAILEHTHDAARDSTAATRMMGNLLGEVLSLQKGLFRTETIQHPDREQRNLTNQSS